ncbi:MAG TPA: hypothetical protein VF292_03005 [Rhodanobacteraceae bacterium]
MNAIRSEVAPPPPRSPLPNDAIHTLVLGDNAADLDAFLNLIADSTGNRRGCLYVTGRRPALNEDASGLLCEVSRDGGRTFAPCTYNPIANGAPYQIAGRIVAALCQRGDFDAAATATCADGSVGGALSYRMRDVPAAVASALRAVSADVLAKRWILVTHTWPGPSLGCSTPSVNMDEVVRGEVVLRIVIPDLRDRPCTLEGQVRVPKGTWSMIHHVFASLVLADYASAVARVRIRDAAVKAKPNGTIALFGPSITDGAHLAPLLRVLEQGRAMGQHIVFATQSMATLGDGDANVAKAIEANTGTKVLFNRVGPENGGPLILGDGEYVVVHDGQKPAPRRLPTDDKLCQMARFHANVTPPAPRRGRRSA